MDDKTRINLLTNQFSDLFNQKPTIWAQAPGRVDLMGSHTDYNQGFVLTQAIDRQTWIAASPRDDNQVIVHSLNITGSAEFDLDQPIEYDIQAPWSNYVRGVAEILRQEGYPLRGFNGVIHSTVPVGSGLSSSAALEVAVAVLFNALSDLGIDPVQLALLCQRAENEFVGMNCGILDQYTSTMSEAGSVLLLDCRSITSQTKLFAAGIQVVICDTQAKRELTGSEYPERRAQCEEGARILANFYPQVTALRDVNLEMFTAHEANLPAVVAKRCRFVIEENQRVLDIAEAISAGDREKIRTLTAQSYAGACELYEICSPEMNMMMAAMLSAPGVIAARQAGAGFGGCMAAFVEQDKITEFSQHVSTHYQASSAIEPKVYPVQAAPGAGLLELIV
jgi:galactokinase